MTGSPRDGVLRDRGENRDAQVMNMELFFDLVYVFTIIQLSGHLYADLTWTGALQTLVMFLAVWWGWNYTAWATGSIDPNNGLVVGLLSVLMILGLVTAAAIPEAFAEHGQLFAEAYVAMQLIRGAFMVWAFGAKETMGRNYLQLLAWTAVSGVVWIVGGFTHDATTRLIIWAFAAAIEFGAPLHGFHLPGLGSRPMRRWTLSGGHLAERCQLVLMIAFGETVLRLGESYAETHATDWVNVSLILGFVMIAALWSMYFLHHAPVGAERVRTADDEEAAELVRSAYTYAHMLMVGAVIVIAVAVHMAIEHPTKDVHLDFELVCLGGAALYLIGLTMSKSWLGHGRMLPGVVGLIALLVLGTAASLSDRVVELAVTAAVAVGLAVWAQIEPEKVESQNP